jgi:hypothetical protein
MNRRKAPAEHGGARALELLEPALGQLAAELSLSTRDDVPEQQALVVTSGLLERGREPLSCQRGSKDAVGDALTIDENAVAIEDDEVKRFVSRRASPHAADPRPTVTRRVV